MIEADRLDRIASFVAMTDGSDADDVRQEIHIKFWKYPPRTVTGAFIMARHARGEYWRKEARHRHHAPLLADMDVPYTIDALVEARDVLRRYARVTSARGHNVLTKLSKAKSRRAKHYYRRLLRKSVNA